MPLVEGSPTKLGRPKGLPKTGGRVKGTPNKLTRTALEAISFAAEELGGGERLVEWVKESKDNEKVFWGSVYPKLLPLQLTGANGGPIQGDISLTVSFKSPINK